MSHHLLINGAPLHTHRCARTHTHRLQRHLRARRRQKNSTQTVKSGQSQIFQLLVESSAPRFLFVTAREQIAHDMKTSRRWWSRRCRVFMTWWFKNQGPGWASAGGKRIFSAASQAGGHNMADCTDEFFLFKVKVASSPVCSVSIDKLTVLGVIRRRSPTAITDILWN